MQVVLLRLGGVYCLLIRMLYLLFFFFFKQKTAYELCGRDWSSDVCSSDLTVKGSSQLEKDRNGDKLRKMETNGEREEWGGMERNRERWRQMERGRNGEEWREIERNEENLG